MNPLASPRILTASIAALLSFQTARAAESPAPLFTSKTVHLEPAAIRVELNGAKELFLVATDAGDGFNSDWAEWLEPTLVKADGSKIKLTDLKPKLAKAGWNEVRTNVNSDVKPMRVAGQPVEFGFAAHAPSVIGFDLPAGVVAFEARGGIDEAGTSQGKGATVIFKIYAQNPGEAQLAGSQQKSNPTTKPYGIEAARELVKTMVAAEGLEPSLFAAEPMVQNPTNIDIDHRGRVWALEQVNYRKWAKPALRPEGDRVVILEDADGDGVAEKETTFFQSPDLSNPLGICVLPGPGGAKAGTRVIVSAAPNVWLLTDTDGDDKADKKELLLTGIRGESHDHTVHAFSFGADGKLYFNMGNAAVELRGPDDKIITDVAGNLITDKAKPYRQGMVFRCDLVDGKLANIETLGWNFRNNYEVCVDSFGTMWQSDNDDDGNKGVRINYVMDYGNYGYTDEVSGASWQTARTNIEKEIPLRHWHQNDPGVVPNLLQTGAGSPTGILVNEGAALGAKFTNQLIHCDAGPRVVRAYPVEKDGAGFKATMVDILTAPDDTWFRPSDVAIAPDGSLFVADWYDPGVGGHAMGDNDAQAIRGRVYRVAAKGAKLSVPKSDFSTAASCAAALQSPNRATQYLAWQRLHALGAEAAPELQKMWKSENPRLRARALQLLARLPGKADETLAAALMDPDANLRVTALRIGRELAPTGDSAPFPKTSEAAEKLLANERDPQVNRELALALSIVKDRTSIAEAWAVLAQKYDGKDRWYLEALGIAARGAEDACFDAWMKGVSSAWEAPANRDILWRLRSAKSAEYLARILTDKTTTEEEAPRFLRAFDFLPDGEAKTKSLVQLAALGAKSQMIAGEALGRLKTIDINANAGMKQAVLAMLDASKGTARFVELVRDFKLHGQGDGLLAVVNAAPTSPAGVEAAKMLLGTDNAATMEKAMKGVDAIKLLDAIGATADQRAVPLLSGVVSDPARDAEARKQAVRSLAKSPAGVQELLALAKKGAFPEELKLSASGALAAVQMPQFSADITQFFPMPNAAGGKALPPIAELVKTKGDAAHGKAIFAKVESTCTTCHRVGDIGVDFAPALGEIGSKLGKDALYESIINPNAGVSMGFETTQLTLKNGEGAVGIVRSDTAEEVVLAMPGGAQNRFKKGDVAKREKLAYSMMPAGLQAMFPAQDFVDLVEYLASLKTPAK